MIHLAPLGDLYTGPNTLSHLCKTRLPLLYQLTVVFSFYVRMQVNQKSIHSYCLSR